MLKEMLKSKNLRERLKERRAVLLSEFAKVITTMNKLLDCDLHRVIMINKI